MKVAERRAGQLRLSGGLRVGGPVRDAPAVDNRHRPYDPYDPNARPQPREEDGWVVAGEEPDEWAPPPPRNGHPGQSPRYGRPAGQPPEYGGRYPPDPRGQRYPPRAYPPDPYQRPAYDPRPPAYPGAYAAARRTQSQPPADDLDDEPRPALASSLSWTIAAFLLPMLLYLAWAFTRSGVAPAGCVDPSGAPCPSPRVEAAQNLLDVLPALVGALMLALLIAIGLRRIATGWRSLSVGLAAAVIGAGVATFAAAVLN